MATKEKNISELRNILYEEISDLRAKRSTPAKTNAVSTACGKILTSLKLQLDFHKLSNKKTAGAVITKLLT